MGGKLLTIYKEPFLRHYQKKMFRPAAVFVIGYTIFLAVFAARVSGKTIVTTIQQTDLEAMLSLTKSMTNKPPSWRPDNAACNWQGAVCAATGSVNHIVWYHLGLGGSANLTMLPQGLTFLTVYKNNLTGVVDLTSLQQGLQSLFLNDNAFSGTPNIASLPKGLQNVGLSNNAFSGTPDLTSLPQGLKYLSLAYNHFSGSGTFVRNQSSSNWCSFLPSQTDMCGQRAGVFNCSAGVWSCAQ